MAAKDVVYYVGLIGGMIIGSMGLRSLGVSDGLLQLLGAVACGVGFGYLSERLFGSDASRGG